MVQLSISPETAAGNRGAAAVAVETVQSTVFVLAEKSEQVQLEQLKQLYAERGVETKVANGEAASGGSPAFNSLMEMLAIDSGTFLSTVCQGSEKEAEMVLNAIFSLIGIFPASPEAKKLVESFGRLVTGDAFQGQGWASPSGVAVRVLSSLFYNYSSYPEMQAIVLHYLLEACGRARLTSALQLDFERLDSALLVAKWHLPMGRRRELLRQLHKTLLADQRHKEAAEVMTQLLRTYDEGNTDVKEAHDDARECVRTALADPRSFALDHLLGLSAVRALEQSDPAIWELLEVFAKQGLAEYKAFVAKRRGFVEAELKANPAEMEKKIRMLTLISLAEENQELALEKVGQALGIDNKNELEEFLVDAMQLNAIGGKINGVKRVLTVHTFQYRNFQRPQWELLREKLQSLLASMRRAHHQIAVTNHSDEV